MDGTAGVTLVVAVPAAVGAGALFATSNVLQQRAARRTPPDESLRPSLLVDLAHRPIWLAGIATAALSFGLQAVALSAGPVTLVQPLIATDLLFALPLAARLQRARLGRREWLGVLAIMAGLAAFLATAAPHGGNDDPTGTSWLLVFAVAGALALACALVGRGRQGPARISLFAVAAGVLFGVMSALTKSVVYLAEKNWLNLFTSWQPYALAVIAISGMLLAQSAFQAGPLAISLPVIDVLEPLVAVIVALVALGERLDLSPARLTVEVIGALAVLGGIFALDRSPLITAALPAPEPEPVAAAAPATEPPARPLPRVESPLGG